MVDRIIKERPRLDQDDDAAEGVRFRARAEADNISKRDRHVTLAAFLSNPALVPNNRPWKGRDDGTKHPEFASFSSAEWGYRAAVIHYRENGVPDEVLVEAGLPLGTAMARGNVLQILRAATRLSSGREAWTHETMRLGARLAAL